MFIGAAFFVAAIRDHQRRFVGGQERGEVGLVGLEIDGAGNVAGLVGVGAVDVDERDLAGGDGGFQFIMGNIGNLVGAGEHGADERETREEGEEEFFHNGAKIGQNPPRASDPPHLAL